MSTVITKVQRGRTRTVQVQVLTWRRRRKRFEAQKDKLTQRVIDAHNGDIQASLAWFSLPSPELSGKAPRDLFNPVNIRWLREHVAKTFKKS